MNTLNLFPSGSSQSTKLLFVNYGTTEEKYCLPLVKKLRQAGIRAELFPGNVKMDKQLKYANNRDIPYVAFVGENEIKNEIINLKNMQTGEQVKLTFDELLKKF
jgi:histidyl-tRNA synthetase